MLQRAGVHSLQVDVQHRRTEDEEAEIDQCRDPAVDRVLIVQAGYVRVVVVLGGEFVLIDR